MKSSRTRLNLEPLEGRAVPTVLGTLDTSFGSAGLVSFSEGIPIFPYVKNSGAVDFADRVVVSRTQGYNDRNPTAVIRLAPDGTPDAAFGTYGTFTFPAGTLVGSPKVTLDAAGDIYVAARAPGTDNLAVAKILPTGVLDATFGTGGVTSVAFPNGYGYVAPLTVMVGAGGAVSVVEGLGLGATNHYPPVTGVVRLTPAGVLDPAFAGGSTLVLSDFAVLDETSGAALDPSGRVVLMGSDGFTGGVGIARLTTAGAYDPAFGGTGHVTLANSAMTDGILTASLALNAAGEVYVGGGTGVGTVMVVKFTTAGTIDTTFGNQGVATESFGPFWGGYNTVHGLAVAPDGSVLGAATINSGDTKTLADFAVFKLTPTGQLDQNFNPGGPQQGVNVFDFRQNDIVRWLALTPEGDVVVGGGLYGSGVGFTTEVAKLHGTGTDLPVPPPLPANPFGDSGGSVRMALGDVNGDGQPDGIFVTGPGVPLRVAVVSGADGSILIAPFDPFGDDFTGGGFVAAGDFDGDGRDEFVVTPDDGGGPRAVIYSVWNAAPIPPSVTLPQTADGSSPPPVSQPLPAYAPDWRPKLLASFLGIDDPNFRGGARVAVGDVNGDGTADLTITAGNGGGPRVALLDGKTLMTTPTKLVNDFFALSDDLTNGVFVTAEDLNRDGKADLVFGAGPGGAPRVIALSGQVLLDTGPGAATTEPIANFFAGNTDGRDGVQVLPADESSKAGARKPGQAPIVVVCFTGAPADAPAGFATAALADAPQLGVYVG